MLKQYKIISGDSHLDLPPDRWTHRVPAKWKDRAPRRVKMPNGEEAIAMEGRPIAHLQVRLGAFTFSFLVERAAQLFAQQRMRRRR